MGKEDTIKDQLRLAFTSARLSHPMVGYKYDSFEDYYSSLDKDVVKENKVNVMTYEGLKTLSQDTLYKGSIFKGYLYLGILTDINFTIRYNYNVNTSGSNSGFSTVKVLLSKDFLDVLLLDIHSSTDHINIEVNHKNNNDVRTLRMHNTIFEITLHDAIQGCFIYPDVDRVRPENCFMSEGFTFRDDVKDNFICGRQDFESTSNNRCQEQCKECKTRGNNN